jgi:two-component system, NarL family, response regulator DevR
VTARRATGRITDPLVATALEQSAAARPSRRAPTEAPIRVLLVDMQRMVLFGLSTLFRSARNCEVVGEATTAEQAVRLSAMHQPEVVVLDGDFPESGAIVATEQICTHSPTTRVVVRSTALDPPALVAAVHAGASGYVLKRTDPVRLVDAVEVVAEGGYVFDEAVASAMTDWYRAGSPTSEPMERLTQQERRIIRLIADGMTNRDIGSSLGLSEYTVKTYVSSVLRKLGLASRAEAAAFIARSEPPPAD